MPILADRHGCSGRQVSNFELFLGLLRYLQIQRIGFSSPLDAVEDHWRVEHPLRFSTEETNATVFCFEERVVNPKTGSSCALKITIHPLHHKKAWKISPLDGHWTGEWSHTITTGEVLRAPQGEGNTPRRAFTFRSQRRLGRGSTKSRPGLN